MEYLHSTKVISLSISILDFIGIIISLLGVYLLYSLYRKIKDIIKNIRHSRKTWNKGKCSCGKDLEHVTGKFINGEQLGFRCPDDYCFHFIIVEYDFISRIFLCNLKKDV